MVTLVSHPLKGEARRIHLDSGRRQDSLVLAGSDLILSESRRAVGLDILFGARHSRGSYGVRCLGCGQTDRVCHTPKN